MNFYVIPDIHGRNDLLQKALDYIKQKEPDGTKIVFLGDYIDRGDDNVGVLKTVMNPPEGYEFVTLMGNHEDMFIGAVLEGTGQFYDMRAFKEIDDSDLDVFEVARWMAKLKLCHMEGNNVFAHAWYDLGRSPEHQHKTEVLWRRVPDPYPFGTDELEPKHLTHGHTPRQHGPTTAINRTNLDCGAVFSGRLVVARFVEGKLGPQELIEIT